MTLKEIRQETARMIDYICKRHEGLEIEHDEPEITVDNGLLAIRIKYRYYDYKTPDSKTEQVVQRVFGV